MTTDQKFFEGIEWDEQMEVAEKYESMMKCAERILKKDIRISNKLSVVLEHWLSLQDANELHNAIFDDSKNENDCLNLIKRYSKKV